MPKALILCLCLPLFALLISLHPLRAGGLEVSGSGGFGVAERDAFGIRTVPSAGAAFGCPIGLRHKLEFDYLVGQIERETASRGGYAPSIERRHFFTANWALELRTGRTRPFLQFGAGALYETNNDNQVVNRILYDDARVAYAGIAGFGVTIQLGRSVFLRPQVRTLLAPGRRDGISVTALPSLGVGWRF